MARWCNAEPGVFAGRQVAEAAVWSNRVVVDPPDSKRLADMAERSEQCLVQKLIAQSAVEALDEGVLLRLARCDVMPIDPGLL